MPRKPRSRRPWSAPLVEPLLTPYDLAPRTEGASLLYHISHDVGPKRLMAAARGWEMAAARGWEMAAARGWEKSGSASLAKTGRMYRHLALFGAVDALMRKLPR